MGTPRATNVPTPAPKTRGRAIAIGLVGSLGLVGACGGARPPAQAHAPWGAGPAAAPPLAPMSPAGPAAPGTTPPPPPPPWRGPEPTLPPPQRAPERDPTCPEVHVLGAANGAILREAIATCVAGRRFGAEDTAALLAAIGDRPQGGVHPKCAAGYPTLHLVDARGEVLRLPLCVNVGARDVFAGFGAIRARDPAAIDRWLRDRGFSVPERSYAE